MSELDNPTQNDEAHSTITLLELDGEEPLMAVGESEDHFRLIDGDLQKIEVVDTVELDEPVTLDELRQADFEDLSKAIRTHFELDEGDWPNSDDSRRHETKKERENE